MARLDAPRPDRPDPRVARRRPAVPRHLPRAPAPVRRQRRGRRDDPRRRCPAGRSGSIDAPTLPAHRLEPGRADARRTRCSTASTTGADFYFVHSYAGVPATEARATLVLATTDHGAPFVSAIARGAAARRPVPPRTERRRRPAPAGQLRRARPGRLMLRRRVIPCLDVADGRVVKGTRFVDLVDEGDPPELAERYAAEGADELVFLDITAAPERRGDAPRHRRADGPAGVHPADGRRRRADRRRDARRPAGRRRQGLAQHGGGRRSDAHQPLRRRGSGARRSSSPSTRAVGRRRPTATPTWEVVVKGGREPTGLDAVAWARARRRARRRRAARHLDRSRRDRRRASTPTLLRAITVACRRPGHRLGRRGRARRLRRARSATAAPTPSSPPRSSTAGSTRSPTSRRRWRRPACRSGSSPQAVA